MATDNSNNPTKIVRLKDLLDVEEGGVLEISDGAEANVESGGVLNIKTGGELQFNGTDYAAELEALAAGEGALSTLAAVETELSALAADQTPLSTLAAVETELSALAADQVALSALAADQVALSAIAALQTEIEALGSEMADHQKMVGIQEVMIASVGTWTKTRVAQGDYVLRHTPADDTSVLGIDITPEIRAAADKGFKLTAIRVVHKIGTLALDAHTLTLDKIAYANNVAVAVTSIPLTGSLNTAVQANPYVDSLSVTTPAYNITANSKYVAELTVDAAATSDYDFYGLNLVFTRSQA